MIKKERLLKDEYNYTLYKRVNYDYKDEENIFPEIKYEYIESMYINGEISIKRALNFFLRNPNLQWYSIPENRIVI